jgi:hypothetical protein
MRKPRMASGMKMTRAQMMLVLKPYQRDEALRVVRAERRKALAWA